MNHCDPYPPKDFRRRVLCNDTYTFYVASEKGTVDMKINRTDIFSNRIFIDHAEANSSTHLYNGWHNFAI